MPFRQPAPKEPDDLARFLQIVINHEGTREVVRDHTPPNSRSHFDHLIERKRTLTGMVLQEKSTRPFHAAPKEDTQANFCLECGLPKRCDFNHRLPPNDGSVEFFRDFAATQKAQYTIALRNLHDEEFLSVLLPPSKAYFVNALKVEVERRLKEGSAPPVSRLDLVTDDGWMP